MFKNVFATAIFLTIFCGCLPTLGHARTLHPACNVSMPCEVTNFKPQTDSDVRGKLYRAANGYRSIKVSTGRYRSTLKGGDQPRRKSVRAKYAHTQATEKTPISLHKDRIRGGAQERSILSSPQSTAGSLVARARAYLGQTARQVGVRSTLWCSAFLRHLTGATGVDDRAISWLAKRRIGKQVGAIAVMRHHVGVVSGFDRLGNPILISGNHSRRVGEGTYSARRVLAYVSL